MSVLESIKRAEQPHNTLRLAKLDLEAARENLKKVAKRVQASCEHAVVLHYDASSGPMRICPHCGLEEWGSYWSTTEHWSEAEYKPTKLGNTEGRVIRKVQDQEFFRHRI